MAIRQKIPSPMRVPTRILQLHSLPRPQLQSTSPATLQCRTKSTLSTSSYLSFPKIQLQPSIPNHIDAAEMLARPIPLREDYLTPIQHALLQHTLQGFLPDPIPGTYDLTTLRPGHHLVYFRQPLPPSYLMADGTDILHAPNPSWGYRVWAGGWMKFPAHETKLDGQRAVLLERIAKVKPMGKDETKPDKVFVDIERVAGIAVAGEPELETRARLCAPVTTTGDEGVMLIESRTLCFLKEIPKGMGSRTKRIAPPEESSGDYRVKLTTDAALLFRFSALSFNAHAIHIDPVYTKEIYGLPGLLVHGPLTLVMMFEVLDRAIRESGVEKFRVREIDYRNLGPILVGEEIEIVCRAGKKDGAGQEWQVWIQKGGQGEESLVVRGTVKVDVL